MGRAVPEFLTWPAWIGGDSGGTPAPRTLGAGSVLPELIAVVEGREGRGAMAEQPALSFAGLLRQLRGEAKLTQEELAEAAGLSPRSISDLERGVTRTTHKDTAVLLAGALGLAGSTAELFVAAARGKAPPAQVLAAIRGAGPLLRSVRRFTCACHNR